MSVLTVREAQVLWHLAQGCTYARIGDRLGMSLHTVTTHIKSIYRKLEVHCAAAAVRRAIELQVLNRGEPHAAIS
jgi:DNA-binding CsgD family transcriptional regulator